MFSSPVVPAIIPTSVEDIYSFTSILSGVPEIHVDVVDGKFVPFCSWPYSPIGEPSGLESICRPFTLEVDLMVDNPIRAARDWLAAGADMLVFHIETIAAESLKSFCDETNITVGVSILNDTPLSRLDEYIPFIDYVQFMGIDKIGAQGQPFDERVLNRIIDIRTKYHDLMISIDGSVNEITIPKLLPLKLDRYIMGSAITKAIDPLAAYKHYTQVFSSTGKQ